MALCALVDLFIDAVVGAEERLEHRLVRFNFKLSDVDFIVDTSLMDSI